MTLKPGIRDLLWAATGGALLLVLVLFVLHFQTKESPADRLAFKTKRLELVALMRLTLASATEAEKSAVLATTDDASRTFAEQARRATAEVELKRTDLGQLLATGGTAREKELLDEFSKAFVEFQRTDDDLLSLAVKNTNIKAYSLAFGPAADAVQEMDGALVKLVEKSAGSAQARDVAILAYRAGLATLRIQTLLAPHIAEESDMKMDELEAQMANEDEQVRRDLDSLAEFPILQNEPELKTVVADYAQFSEIRKNILQLSRENTNVRSLAILLGEKRKVSLLCQDALSALHQTIQEEPIAGVDFGAPSNPRALGGGTPSSGN